MASIEIRLQKYLADNGIASRRKSEELIAAGKVKVNGHKALIGQKINPKKDIVTVHGKKVIKKEGLYYIMLNKPRGFVTTMSDEQNRRTVADLVSDTCARVYPVGRLDMDSDGLLLLTNDGELTNKLTHPRHEIPKIYRVSVEGKVSEDQLYTLRSPMVIDDYEILPVKVEVASAASTPNGKSTLKMTLYEGRNRQIRKMCDTVGLKITRLCRVAIGDLELGDLPIGKWRFLTDDEIRYLKGEKTNVERKI